MLHLCRNHKQSFYTKGQRGFNRKDLASLPKEKIEEDEEEKPCVFMTVMGEQPSEGFGAAKRDAKIDDKIVQGELWLIKAQNKDGGWGAGSHSRQNVMDPHAVSSDPATTAMTAMALYRSGYNLESGKYSDVLKKSLDYLLLEIEKQKTTRISLLKSVAHKYKAN